MTAESVFLIPNGTFFFELLAVFFILWFAKRKILPRLDTAIAARQAKIKESLEAADRAKSDAEAADEARQALLSEARSQARDIVAGAQATSDQIKAQQGARGQEEYDRIVGHAAAEVSAIRQRAIDEASGRIGEVVFDLVNKIVGREVDQGSHQALVNEAVTALNAEAQRGAAG
jgi:F-type H+-transporting ATPase subunit b